MAGRPTKITPEIGQQIREAILAGAPLHVAASHGGIHEATLHRYSARGKAALEQADLNGEPVPDSEAPYSDFYETVEAARREWELAQLAVIRRAATGVPATDRNGQPTPIVEVETRTTYDELGNMTGRIVTERRGLKPDWRAAMTMLERRDPQTYGRTTKTEISGPGGTPIEVSVEDLVAKAAEQIDELTARRDRKTG